MIGREKAPAMLTKPNLVALVTIIALAAVLSLIPERSQPAAASTHASSVVFFQAAQVTDAFSKGAVLFEGPRYMVHTSRREKPGQAEIHVKDADIIHVLDGEATFVTGGEVVDGSTTAPDEIRGVSIRGGETMHLAKGDVVIVPEGTPHWFREIEGTFIYYVVKVR